MSALANGVTTEKADLLFASLPMRILPEMQVPVYRAMAKRDAEFYSQLEAAGFDLDFGVDGSGLFVKYLRRGSGYYIDVRASQLIIDGRVQLRSGEVSKITGNAVVLNAGTELEADLIVYASGYGSMNGCWLTWFLLKSRTAWGSAGVRLGHPDGPGPWEGELRNMWKPTNVPSLWIHGGNLHQSRQAAVDSFTSDALSLNAGFSRTLSQFPHRSRAPCRCWGSKIANPLARWDRCSVKTLAKPQSIDVARTTCSLCQNVAMNEQAPAGWYPDQEGNMSYWDGAAWSELVRSPGGEATTAVDLTRKKDGAFSKLGAVVKKAAADRQTAKEELGRKHAADAEAAGALVTSGVFGASTIEIYQGGYVRVAAGLSNATQPATISKDTPYEKLRSIKFTQPGQDQASGATSGLEGALGPALSGLMKGGQAFMKGSAPGLAVAGITHLATNAARKPFLTIVTDKEIHTLINQISTGLFNKSTKGHNEVGLVLEAAGNSVLGVVEVAAHQPASEFQPVVGGHTTKVPTLAERLRELADLHKDGILSDDEFAAAKGKLLAGL